MIVIYITHSEISSMSSSCLYTKLVITGLQLLIAKSKPLKQGISVLALTFFFLALTLNKLIETKL